VHSLYCAEYAEQTFTLLPLLLLLSGSCGYTRTAACLYPPPCPHLCRYCAMSSPMPVPASPAPRNSTRCSLKGLPVARAADSRPARVMQAVPCTSKHDAAAQGTSGNHRRYFQCSAKRVADCGSRTRQTCSCSAAICCQEATPHDQAWPLEQSPAHCEHPHLN
jgi:hypothetical protein